MESMLLEHPLWKIDKSLGDGSWGFDPDATSTDPGPIMPTPTFTIPLLPIDPWFSANPAVLNCADCNEVF